MPNNVRSLLEESADLMKISDTCIPIVLMLLLLRSGHFKLATDNLRDATAMLAGEFQLSPVEIAKRKFFLECLFAAFCVTLAEVYMLCGSLNGIFDWKSSCWPASIHAEVPCKVSNQTWLPLHGGSEAS